MISSEFRPRTDEVTLSLLKRAKANGYSALVVTLDTMTIGWRPHDLETAYLPFFHGIGSQLGTSDPVFMGRYGLQPVLDERPEFPHDPAKLNKLIAEGDEKSKQASFLGKKWLAEISPGRFRPWEDVKFLRDNWEGPLLLKGIQCAQVSTNIRERLILYLPFVTFTTNILSNRMLNEHSTMELTVLLYRIMVSLVLVSFQFC